MTGSANLARAFVGIRMRHSGDEYLRGGVRGMTVLRDGRDSRLNGGYDGERAPLRGVGVTGHGFSERFRPWEHLLSCTTKQSAHAANSARLSGRWA